MDICLLAVFTYTVPKAIRWLYTPRTAEAIGRRCAGGVLLCRGDIRTRVIVGCFDESCGLGSGCRKAEPFPERLIEAFDPPLLNSFLHFLAGGIGIPADRVSAGALLSRSARQHHVLQHDGRRLSIDPGGQYCLPGANKPNHRDGKQQVLDKFRFQGNGFYYA